MDLSIIIPVYNSELILPSLVKEIENSLKNKKLNKEIIFINDFSKDNSWKIIKDLSNSSDFIKGINLKLWDVIVTEMVDKVESYDINHLAP